jgi:hypothetical protein
MAGRPANDNQILRYKSWIDEGESRWFAREQISRQVAKSAKKARKEINSKCCSSLRSSFALFASLRETQSAHLPGDPLSAAAAHGKRRGSRI